MLLICGVDTIGVGRLPRLWFNAGYEVHVLGSDRLVACKSPVVTVRIPCAPGPEAAVRRAREYLSKERARYQNIVLADEPSLWALLDDEPAGWAQDWLPVPFTAPCLARVRSKTEFLCAARDAGIITPQFDVCTDEKGLRRAAESLGYPVYIKANKGWAGSGLRFADSPASLEAQIGDLPFENPLVIQREITGQPASISVLYDHGVPICWFAYLMLRSWPNRFSSASSIQMFPHPAAGPLVDAVGRLTQFTGLAGIDFVWDSAKDQVVILEFNPRPTPVYHLGPHAGVDFARALREMASGKIALQVPNQSRAIINLFPQLLFYAADHFRPLLFLSAFADAPWREPTLAAAQLRRFLTHYIPESVKQKLKR